MFTTFFIDEVIRRKVLPVAAMDEAAQYFDAALSLIDDEQQETRGELLYRRGSIQLSLGQLDDFLADPRVAFENVEGRPQDLHRSQAVQVKGSDLTQGVVLPGGRTNHSL